jgi:hypothetical protein
MQRPSSPVVSAWLLLALLVTACATPPDYDYSALQKSRPRSILVIPPMNNSIEVNAPYIFLSTISRPLAEKGYYVFPVAVIDYFLKENGLPTPDEMNAIPLDKIERYIGADAVLYVSIEDWGQKYQLLTSTTVVRSTLRLLDARTGELLWQTTARAVRSSDDGSQDLLGAIVGAIATQIAGSVSDATPGLSSIANREAINNRANGLLHGPYFNPTAAADGNAVKPAATTADAADESGS